MAIEPIAADELDTMRGGLRVRGHKVPFGIQGVGRHDGRVIATYRYKATAETEAPAPSAAAAAVAQRSHSMSASGGGKARVTVSSPGTNGAPLRDEGRQGQFGLTQPQVIARGALRPPYPAEVNYLTTGQSGLKRPVTAQQIGRFRVITGGVGPRDGAS